MGIVRLSSVRLGSVVLAGAILFTGCYGVSGATSDTSNASASDPPISGASSEAQTQDPVSRVLFLVGAIGDRLKCDGVPYHFDVSVNENVRTGTAFHDPWTEFASYVTEGYRAYENVYGSSYPREIMISRSENPQHWVLDIVVFPPETGSEDALSYLKDHQWQDALSVQSLGYHTPASISAVYAIQEHANSPLGPRYLSVLLDHKGRLYDLNVPENPDSVVETVFNAWMWTTEDPTCPTRPGTTTLPYTPFGSYTTFAPFRLLAPKDLPFSTSIPAELPGLPDGFAVRNVQVGDAKGVMFGDLPHDREVMEVLFMPSGSSLKQTEAVLQEAIKPYKGKPYNLHFMSVANAPGDSRSWMIEEYNGVDPQGSIQADVGIGEHKDQYFIYMTYGWYEADLFPTLDEWRWDDGKSFEEGAVSR